MTATLYYCPHYDFVVPQMRAMASDDDCTASPQSSLLPPDWSPINVKEECVHALDVIPVSPYRGDTSDDPILLDSPLR